MPHLNGTDLLVDLSCVYHKIQMLTDFTVWYNKIYFQRSKDTEQIVFENVLNIFRKAVEESEYMVSFECGALWKCSRCYKIQIDRILFNLICGVRLLAN